MECPHCQAVNPPEASYCSNCGRELPEVCPVCAHPVPPGARFCPNCGHRFVPDPSDATDLSRHVPAPLLSKIEAARSGQTMAGERRTVTMLFADVKGSTTAAEQLDPEDWAEVINGAFERMIQPIYRYEGTLTRLQGDAVLAFFGAPIAHEDDPERAVMAGLEMLEAFAPFSRRVESEWHIPMRIRIGVNTGLVVVGEVGSDLRVEYSALGDAVNIAARMEQTAEPGTVQISEDTYRLVAPLFEFVELGPTQLKGKSEPIETFRPVRRKERPGSARGVRGVSSTLVGRNDEMTALRDLSARLVDGRGSICTIVGDAGVGKSRLITELRSELEVSGRLGRWWSPDGDGSVVGWGQGRSLSYNTTVPYSPIIDLLGYCLDLHDEDSDAVKSAKLSDTLEGLVGDRHDELFPFLSTLLGIDSGPATAKVVSNMAAPLLQRRTFDAVEDLITAASSARPLILVLEDLHWADAVTLALVQELMAVTDRGTLMMVIAMRPNREDTSWHLPEHAARRYHHRHTSLVLEPLDDEAMSLMVDQVLGEGVDETVRAALMSRSEGNPFYVEEMISSLADSGALVEEGGSWHATEAITDVDVSPTIAGLLTSRLDRLDEDSRVIAQLASVIGREFRLSELEHLVADHVDLEQSLDDLLRRNLLEERSRLPERVYAFRHALVQETAYSSVLRRARRRLHGRIGAFLEETRGDDVQQIAHHLYEAGEGGRALPYLVEAGDRAARAMSLADAIRFYDRALSVPVEDEDLDLVRRAHEGLGGAYTLIPDLTHAASAYQGLLEFGQTTSQPRAQVTALNRLGFATAALGGDYDRATEYLETARRLAEDHDDELGLAEYHMNSCLIATGRGDMEKAAAHDAEVSTRGAALGSVRFRMQGLVQRAISLANGGQYEDGELALSEAARAADESDEEIFQAAVAAIASPPYLLRRGEVEEAYWSTRRGFEIIERLGSSWAAETAMMAGYIARLLGRYEEALALGAQSTRLGSQLGQFYISAASAAQLARVYAEVAADESQVAEWRAKSAEGMTMPMGDMFSATIWGQLGWADLQLGNLDGAGENFEQSLASSSATRYLERPWSLMGSAEVHLAMGDMDEADSRLAEARRFVDDKQLRQVQPELALVTAKVSIGRGDLDAALSGIDAAAAGSADMGLMPVRWRSLAVRGRVQAALGNHDESVAAAQAARATIESVAADIVDEQLRHRFLHVTTVSADIPTADSL